jgi:hypothetical protein
MLTTQLRLISCVVCAWHSPVGIATSYGLDGPGIEFRWLRLSAPVQTGPGVHPAYCTMGTGSLPEVKRTGRGVDHPPHQAPRLKKEKSQRSAAPLCLHGRVQVEIYLYLLLCGSSSVISHAS